MPKMNLTLILPFVLSAGVLLTGCPNTEPSCDPGFVLVDDGTLCVPADGGTTDSGADADAGDAGDASPDAPADSAVDAGPCGMECTGTTPLCNTTTGMCVACIGDTDCTDVAAAKCGTDGMCTTCDDSMQCAGLGDTTLCGDSGVTDGRCIQCTEADEATQCGTFACDWRDGTCTSTMRTADTCDACTSDAECAVGRRCVDHVFGGSSVGTFCFFDSADGGCGDTDAARRPYRTRITLGSVDGWMSEFCMPPTTTTCQGISDTQNVACTMNT
ncbi:MAG: hypothetical protein DRJ42_26700, partial [Deltaproteobacteria bacterium]